MEALGQQSVDVNIMQHQTYISAIWQRRLNRLSLTNVPKLRSLFIGTAVSEWLSSLEPRPDVVVVLGTDVRFLRPARKWAAKYNIPIINDVVDWYQIREGGSFGEKFFIALNNYWAMPFESAKCDATIVVSKLLASYYEDRRVPNIRIPAIIARESALRESAAADEPKYSDQGGLHLAYVGAPGKRDIATIENLQTLIISPPSGVTRLTVRIVGWKRKADSNPKIPVHDNFIEYGRVARADAMSVVIRSDFTVLQRPASKRFAQAGFPSKVAESLLLGTPVISNKTSDIAEFLVDGVNGIILADDSVDQLRLGVARAAAWLAQKEGPDRVDIENHARAAFSPKGNAGQLKDFVVCVLTSRRSEA